MSTSGKRPKYITPERAGAFQFESVARAYPKRPPYPHALVDALGALVPEEGGSMLELGCGTGELSRRLAPRLAHVDAVDPSAAMMEVGRGEEGGDAPSLHWTQSPGEAFTTERRYDLVLTALSLHWMEWEEILPKIVAWLKPGGVYVMVLSRTIRAVPWADAIQELVPRYSLIQDFQPIDFRAEVDHFGLFDLSELHEVGPERFEQTVDDYLDSWFSRAGFVRDRLAERAANEFRAGIADSLQPHARFGTDGRQWVDIDVRATFVIARPRRKP